MAEITRGIRHILSSPFLYDVFQTVVGGYAWRRNAIQRFISGAITPNALVVDIGCGTSKVLEFLPSNIEYVGFDRNEEYINYARARQKHHQRRFICEEVSLSMGLKGKRADIVLAFGLLHHLEDLQAHQFFLNAKDILNADGFLVTLDPLYTNTQSFLARYIISKDRGTAVREEADYRALASGAFSSVEVHVDHNPMFIPYTGIVMKCSNVLYRV